MPRSLAVLLATCALVVAGGSCGHRSGGATATTTTADPADATTEPATSTSVAVGTGSGGPVTSSDPIVIAAGDIGSCSSDGDEATAALVDRQPGTVLTLGDTAYERGTAAEYATCYGPTWGRFKDRTKPAPGNHDYGTGVATGYFGYFGVPDHYSFDLGAWHLIALDSNCGLVGGCGPGSPEERWLRADMAAHPARCTLAYWHHPRWSSGLHHSSAAVDGLWQAMVAGHGDVVLNGHDHDYERFAPIQGVREFVVGTGGRSHYPFGVTEPGSEVRNGETFGVLVLTLHPTSYDWRFVPAGGSTFTDRGSSPCQ